MWQNFLQKNYISQDEWQYYSDLYNLAERLGYATADEAWEDNPFIQGSTNPADFGKADLAAYYGKRMVKWDLERLSKEAGWADNPDAWARPVVKEAWCKAVKAEMTRRGLTFPV